MGAAQLIEADETGREGAATHLYTDQLPDEAAIDALHYHTVSYDKSATEHNVALAEELFGDILPIKACGVMLWLALWDRIVFWRGAEKVLYSLIDEPELLHRLMAKLVDIENDYIDQLEAQNLLYTGPGAAQIFSEVSPAMHDEFEIEYMKYITTVNRRPECLTEWYELVKVEVESF